MEAWHLLGSERLQQLLLDHLLMFRRGWRNRDFVAAKAALFLMIRASTILYERADREERRARTP